MANILMDTVDLEIFDSSGKLITKINHNQKAFLNLGYSQGTFGIQSAMLDLDLLSSFGETASDEDYSDFEKSLKSDTKRISFKKDSPHQKRYKILAKGILHDSETGAISHDFSLVIHEARLHTKETLSIDANAGEVFTPNYVFELKETVDGKYVDLETKKR